jgi:hypothetical protein
MLVYIANDKKFYLTAEGKFVEDFRQLMPIQCEVVSKGNSHQPKMFRLKCFNKFYITESEKGILMDDKKSDKNLIYQTWKNIHFLNSTMCIEAEKKLSTLFEYNEKKLCPIYPHEDSYLRFDNVLDTKMKELYVNGFCVMELGLDVRSKDLFDRCKYMVHASGEKKLSVLKTDSCFQKLLYQEEVKTMMDDIYGKNNYHLTAFNSNKINKGLNSSSDDWSVGHPYNTITGNFPTKTLGIQVMYLLDDFTHENGGHGVCVYSQTFRCNPTKDLISQNEKYTHRIIAKKGSVIFMLGNLWNQEVKNDQDVFKSSLIATFSSMDVAPKPDLKQHFVFQNNVLTLKEERIVFSDNPLSDPLSLNFVSEQKRQPIQPQIQIPLSFPASNINNNTTIQQPQQLQNQTQPVVQNIFGTTQPQQLQTQQLQTQQLHPQQLQTQTQPAIQNIFGTTQPQPQIQQQMPVGIPNIFGNTTTNVFDTNFGTGLFGTTTTNTNTNTGTGLFGTTITNNGTGNGTGLFGTTTNNTNTGTGLFGVNFGIPEKKDNLNNPFGNTQQFQFFGK